MAFDPDPGVLAPAGTLSHSAQEPATRTLILSLLLLVDLTTQATTLDLPALPDGGLAYKQVQNIHERRFADLVEQRTDFSCDAATFATILEKAYDAPLGEQAVTQGMLAYADPETVCTQSFPMLDIKRYVESTGTRARGYRIEAAQLEQLKVPATVLMEICGYKHFVVLQRTQDEYVYVGDPALGYKRYALTEFAKGWNGIAFAVIGQGYDRGNPLSTPPEPLTACNCLDRFKSVRDAGLMEFGFIQSDFF